MTMIESNNHKYSAVLLVDDDPQSLASTEKMLIRSGETVITASDGQQALEIIQAGHSNISLVITDVRMPRMSGIEFLKALHFCGKDLPVILMTAYGQVHEAVWAMKFGAMDFLTKPFRRETLIQAVKQAKKQLRKLPVPEKAELSPDDPDWISHSLPMQGLMQQARRVAATLSTVLIEGETGTGKEMLARVIHQNGSRSKCPFIAVNCAAIPETLLESELFGYERGAFSGAVQSKAGLFESADGGTLFLDEIGDMPLTLQSKLLRVLQSGEVRRIGSSTTQVVQVRVLSATHKNLRQMVQQQLFREDLFFRLDVVKLTLPPLRERQDDLRPLMFHYLQKFSIKHHKSQPSVSDEFWSAFSTYSWPGNIRELMNVLERAVIFSDQQQLHIHDLPEHIRLHVEQDHHPSRRSKNEHLTVPLGLPLKEVEDLVIQRTLEVTDGDKNMAAKILGINSRTIHRRTRQQESRDTAVDTARIETEQSHPQVEV